jgi:thioredoxin reductase (NADPH)
VLETALVLNGMISMEKTKLAIIGSGPAGYTAGLYSSRDQVDTTLFAGIKSGGQLMFTNDVENFPGYPDGINGPEMMMQLRSQAEKFGTKIVDKFVTAVDFSARPFKLWHQLPAGQSADVFETGSNEEIAAVVAKTKELPHDYEADSIIISTGASSIMVGVPGESELLGKGVSVCAVCDAAFFKEKETFVIGGGDAAMEDSLALAKFAKSVTVLHRRDEFRASKIMQERVLNHDKIKVMWNTTLEAVIGESKVEKIKIKENGEEKELMAEGVFIAIGHKPMTQIFQGVVNLDSHGYVVTRQSFTKAGLDAATGALDEAGLVKFPSMTSVDGVFAAGDVVDVRYKQAITAAGQGCMAALDVERWLQGQQN